MTRHKHAHTGLVTPQLPQLLLTAVLRAFAMLVSIVASKLQMRPRRLPVIGTRKMPDALPRVTSDTIKETQSVAASDTPIMHPTPACHPGSAKRYPGPIHPVGRTSQWLPALRFAAAGMTPRAIAKDGSGPKVRVPGEGRGPVLFRQKRAKRTESLCAKPRPRRLPGMRVERPRQKTLI